MSPSLPLLKRSGAVPLVLAAALLTSACTMNKTEERAVTGAAIGAGVGTAIGALSGGLDMGAGAVIGGIVGTAGGLAYDAIEGDSKKPAQK
jgi:osmotically inducible lipoprotein OsmB